jgi:hypothetical protein
MGTVKGEERAKSKDSYGIREVEEKVCKKERGEKGKRKGKEGGKW